jgi:predicted ATPase
VGTLLGGLSGSGPVLLLVDDLHWGDRPTLRLLGHLLGADEPPGLAIVGTYRETDVVPGHPLASLVGAARHDGRLERLRLHGLDPAAVGELLDGALGVAPPEEAVAALHARTRGNPFYVLEVARGLRAGAGAEVPEAVQEVIGRRVSALGAGATEVLAAAAVVGEEFDLAVVEDVLGDRASLALDALEAATRAELVDELAEAPGRFTFRHALVRDTLLAGVGIARRARLRVRAADALEAAGAEPAAVAGQLLAAGRDGRRRSRCSKAASPTRRR